MASFILLVQVWVTWVFFRAGTFGQAIDILRSMFSFQGGINGLTVQLGGVKLLTLSIIIGVAAMREFWFFMGLNEREILPSRLRVHGQTATLALLIVVCVFFRGPGSQFIYFQF